MNTKKKGFTFYLSSSWTNPQRMQYRYQDSSGQTGSQSHHSSHCSGPYRHYWKMEQSWEAQGLFYPFAALLVVRVSWCTTRCSQTPCNQMKVNHKVRLTSGTMPSETSEGSNLRPRVIAEEKNIVLSVDKYKLPAWSHRVF